MTDTTGFNRAFTLALLHVAIAEMQKINGYFDALFTGAEEVQGTGDIIAKTGG